ncbi:hypothetical protein EVAR_52035_1 [Eumeta japonica]|uniref:Uncharacterized protein n=1 Tax=Eumeta variegata TaxID=151549 RepID=A0A4C1Z3P4_EUMVA|nr:hypothetical protein EVAR_52035_1 [Eumeta japonica]
MDALTTLFIPRRPVRRARTEPVRMLAGDVGRTLCRDSGVRLKEGNNTRHSDDDFGRYFSTLRSRRIEIINYLATAASGIDLPLDRLSHVHGPRSHATIGGLRYSREALMIQGNVTLTQRLPGATVVILVTANEIGPPRAPGGVDCAADVAPGRRLHSDAKGCDRIYDNLLDLSFRY